jgi:GTP-binding protein
VTNSRAPSSVPGHDCGSCALNVVDNGRSSTAVTVALIGNPSSGKSTLFNALTGLRQRVGNWPGTTVERAEGTHRRDATTYRVVDLPGITSLGSEVAEESVAREYLLSGEPDVCVAVVDATRLERHLYLVLQLLQTGRPMVVALNLIDEADRAGLKIDDRYLSRELGLPVVPVVARDSRGLPRLMAAVDQVVQDPADDARAVKALDARIEKATRSVAKELRQAIPGVVGSRWHALRLLEGDTTTQSAVTSGRLAIR